MNNADEVYSLQREFAAKVAAITFFQGQWGRPPQTEAERACMQRIKAAASSAFDVFFARYGTGPSDEDDNETREFLQLTLKLLLPDPLLERGGRA